MQIIVLGDLHIGARNSSEIMMKHQSNFFDFMFQYAKENNIKTIIQLGDCYENRKNINLKTLQFAYSALFDRIENDNIQFYTLLGNHDVFFKNTVELNSSELLLKQYKNIHIFSKPATIKFDNINFDMIPWICEDNKEECFEYIQNSKSEYCCGHFAIDKFILMGSTLFEGGVDRSIFSKYKQVFSGHFHTRSHQDNISYVGTPYQLNWSDAFTPNGFAVFDTNNEKWNYISNPDRYYFYINYDDTNDNVMDVLLEHNLKDTFVKVVIKNKNKPFMYNVFINKIFQQQPADVKIIQQSILDLQNKNTNDEKLKVKDTLDLITDYVNGNDFPNKEGLKAFLIQLYHEASQIQDNSLC